MGRCIGGCCKSSSQCGVRFNRILYTLQLVIPFVCNIIFMYHPEYFDNGFFQGMICYKNNNLEKQDKIYDYVWIFNIRFIFTFFTYHCILLVFSLFSLAPSTTPLAKVVHRGLLAVKIPLLIGLFFLAFAYPNKSMENFQYLMIFLAIVYQIVMVVMATNLSYCIVGPITNAPLALRILMFVLEIILYGLSVTMYAYVFIENKDTSTIVITSIVMVFNLLAFIFSIISKQHSSVAVALPSFVSSMVISYSLFINWGIVKDNIPKGVFYAYASIAAILSIVELIACNTTEITLRPMFAGTDPSAKPQFGSYVSTMEDEDMRSNQSSYYYWAFHFTVLGCLCYMGFFTCLPTCKTMYDMQWYGFGVSSILGFIVILWTEVAQLIFKDRIFY